MNEFNFPVAVRAYLERTKTTQRDLARLAGINEVTLSRIMTGDSEASGATIKRVWPIIHTTKSQVVSEPQPLI